MQTTHEDKSMKPDIEPSRDPGVTANPPSPEELEAERQVALAERALLDAYRNLEGEGEFDKKSPYTPAAVIFLNQSVPGFYRIEELREAAEKARLVARKLKAEREQRIRQYRDVHEGERAFSPGPFAKEEKQAWTELTKAAAKTVRAAEERFHHPYDEGKGHALANAIDAEEEARVRFNAIGQRKVERARREMENESYAAAAAPVLLALPGRRR